MPDELELQKIKRGYPEFLKNLPPKLLKMILSEEMVSQISDICLKNGIKNKEKIEEAGYHITSVLLGKLPPEILSRALAANLKIDALTAKNISEEANRLIFSQIKDDISKLYGGGAAPENPEGKPMEEPKEKPPAAPQKPSSQDVYREQAV